MHVCKDGNCGMNGVTDDRCCFFCEHKNNCIGTCHMIDVGCTNPLKCEDFVLDKEDSSTSKIFGLYFVENGEERLYGKGPASYMTELMNDWIVSCDIYGNDEVTFRVRRLYRDRKEDVQS